MRLPLLLIPLLAVAGCTPGSHRAATPSSSTTPSTATPGTPSTPAAPTPAVTAPAAKPAPAKTTIDLRAFAGPTDNADLFGFDENGSRLFFYAGGAITLPLRVNVDGDHDLVISAACDEANGEKAKFTVSLDGQLIGNEITCASTEERTYVVKAPGLTAGEHKIAIEFTNDTYKENEYDLNLYVHGVMLEPVK